MLETVCLNVLFQLRCQVRAETAMFEELPGRDLGAFRSGLHASDWTLDDVQLNLASLVEVHDLLRSERRDGLGRVGPLPVLFEDEGAAR